jgi:Ca-activated chloride channel family protein
MVMGRVAVAVTQWSGVGQQAIVTDWRRIGSPADAARLAAEVRMLGRRFQRGETNVGGAIAHAAAMFAQVPDCRRRILDLSGDGPENAGHDTPLARARALALGVEINALAIEDAGIAVSNFYARRVISKGGFVVTARGHLDYARSIRAKILRELARPSG